MYEYVCVCICQEAHVEVREHLAGVSSIAIPCSVLWIELRVSDLMQEVFYH